MRSKTQIVSAMRYLVKNNVYMSMRESDTRIVLYRNDMCFHGTIMSLTLNSKGTWDIIEVSSKLTK